MQQADAHAGFEALTDEWDALADRVGAAPFLRSGWFAAWSDAFGHPRPEPITVRRDGSLCGVLPVLAKPPRRLVSPTNQHTPEFGAVVEDEDAARRLAEALIARGPSAIDLSSAARDDALVRGLAESSYRIETLFITESPWIDTAGTWDDYWSGLPAKFRREASRRRRRLAEAAGELTFEFASSVDDVDDLLAEGFAIEGSGWKVEQGTAIASRPETERFYRAIARWAAERGWLQLAFLRVDGRAAAFDFNLEASGRAYVLKGGYDVELSRYAPRTLLTLASLERAFAEPRVRSYEFLGGPDPYKLQLTDLTRERVRVQAFAPGPLGLAQRFVWRRARPAAREVRDRFGKTRPERPTEPS